MGAEEVGEVGQQRHVAMTAEAMPSVGYSAGLTPRRQRWRTRQPRYLPEPSQAHDGCSSDRPPAVAAATSSRQSAKRSYTLQRSPHATVGIGYLDTDESTPCPTIPAQEFHQRQEAPDKPQTEARSSGPCRVSAARSDRRQEGRRSQGGAARWANVSAKERTAHARRAVAARERSGRRGRKARAPWS